MSVLEAYTLPQTVGAADAVLILPAYNEASRQAPAGLGLAPAVEKYHTALEGEYGTAYDIVVVDDGSTDGTAKFAAENGARVISYETNRGRGHALKVGFLSVTSAMDGLDQKAVGYTDADGSYSADTILRLFDAIRTGEADVAVAFRQDDVDQHETWLRRMAHPVMHAICEGIASTGAKDPQAGAKAFRADVARQLWDAAQITGWAADREVLHLAHLARLNVAQVGAAITSVPDSRVNMFRDSLRMVRDSFAIRNSTR